MEDNYIKPIGETLQDKISCLQKELFEEKERNEKYWKQNIEYQNTLEKLQKNTVPISLIQNKIKILEKLQKEFKDNEEIRIKIIAYKELLDERNNTDV